MVLENNNYPLVSVIMGIYNCGDTLREALDCIISQTYKNWEIIMCDDASTDDTKAVAEEYVAQYPDKIRLLSNESNCGLNYTLNKCLAEAQGNYVARMDGDDTCSPERFEKELNVLTQNTEIAFVSTNMEFFDEKGVWGRTYAKSYPEKKDFVKGSPFCHAPCMIRREAFQDVGGYSVSKRLLRVEDYHLWVKLYDKGYFGHNIDQPLYKMRDDRNAVKRKKYVYRINEAYVKALAINSFGLSKMNYILCIRPLLIGLLPSGLYKVLHHIRHRK